ncbi:MAG: energy-coupling factor transporter transmembrane protein EcfT [Ignavibacteria bacterium]|nr:energy-coupling factor transporter transmembrane protein EcfT [Ignavibacteria bacterium]
MKAIKNRVEPDPRAAMMSLGIVSSLPLLVNTWGAIGMSGLYLVTYAHLHHIGPLRLVARTANVIWFIGFITVLNGAGRSGEILFVAGGVAFTLEGLVHGIRISAQLVILLWGSSLLLWSVSPHRLIDGFSSWTRPVSGGSGSVIMLVTVTMNLVPGFILQARRIRLSILARGIEPTGIQNRFRFLSSAALPLFAGSARAGQQIAVAMDARAYQPGRPRSSFSFLRLGMRDYLLMTGAFVVVILSLLVSTS